MDESEKSLETTPSKVLWALLLMPIFLPPVFYMWGHSEGKEYMIPLCEVWDRDSPVFHGIEGTPNSNRYDFN